MRFVLRYSLTYVKDYDKGLEDYTANLTLILTASYVGLYTCNTRRLRKGLDTELDATLSINDSVW